MQAASWRGREEHHAAPPATSPRRPAQLLRATRKVIPVARPTQMASTAAHESSSRVFMASPLRLQSFQQANMETTAPQDGAAVKNSGEALTYAVAAARRAFGAPRAWRR